MINRKVLASFASILVLAVFVVSLNSEPVRTQSNSINAQTARKLILEDNDVIVLDVRTPREFSKGHITSAVNVSVHNSEFSKNVSTLDRDKTYIVHCAVNPRGGRGDKSIKIMTELGFTNLLSLKGGIKAWKRAGFPVNSS